MPALYRSFTALWLGGAGDLYVPYIDARRGIWYNQPQSGLDYPIIFPSEDVRYLIADAYLSYMDPTDDYSGEEYQHPLRIHWMFGFGDMHVPTAPGDPVPTHSRDIIIHDATGRVVFDSTLENTEYEFREWSPWLHVTRWLAPNGNVFSIINFDTWGVDSVPERRRYPESFFPERAHLQSQCVQRIPQRVRAFRSLFSTLSATNLAFAGGWNMELSVSQVPSTPGGRVVTAVTFDAIPGGGEGRFDTCGEPITPAIRAINDVPPTPSGHFIMNADGCYYVRRPYRLMTAYPRELTPEVLLEPGSVQELNLPSDDAGTTVDADGWPASRQYAHLQFGNDCGACCDCSDYIAVAEYIEKQHARYAQIGKDLSEARDIYHTNRDRWMNSRECLQNAPVRVVVLSQACPFVDIAVQVCNQTDKCMVDIDIETTISTVPPGGTGLVIDGYTYMTSPVIINDSMQIPRTYRGSVIGADTARFVSRLDQLSPMTSGSLRFRLGMSDCGGIEALGRDAAAGGYQVIASVLVVTKGKPINPVPVTASDILNCPTTVLAPPTSCVSIP